MNFSAFTDGASRGNPGESGVGIVLKDEQGNTVHTVCGFIGKATNNVAEYTALLTLLDRVRQFDCTGLTVFSDSELMVRQVNGQYKVKDPGLKKLHRQVAIARAALPFPVEVRHVPRSENAEADRLANQGIDSKQLLAPPVPPKSVIK